MLYVFIFTLALCTCIYITPVVMEAAVSYDIVDRPDGNLKQHKRPVAYLGGIAIYLAFLATLALTFDFSREVLGLLLAATIVILLGIIDDLKPLGPKIKLIGQIIAIFVLVKCGIHIKIALLPEWVGILLTFFWMLAVINAFNIIDIMDGLSAGVGCIAALVLFVIALIEAYFMMAVMSLALCGALLGFLRYNFNPAKIYLGDSGSMFIGLMLGALVMIGVYTDNNQIGYLAPILIMGIPLYDTILVMYLRWRSGISIMKGSPDHFALRLRKRGLSTRQTVLLTYACACALGAAALAMKITSSELICAALFACAAACALAATLWLKRIDMQ